MQHEKIELNKLHAQSKVTLISVQAVQGNIYIRSTHTHTHAHTNKYSYGQPENTERERETECEASPSVTVA